jgi:hypothetical protein
MGTRERTSVGPQIFSGWKNIAQYLGMGVRTVQRYERQLGLPIRRPAGEARGTVVATKSELDAWVAASPLRKAFRLTKASASQASNLGAMKLQVAQMCVLRDEMTKLRSEMRASMQSLKNSIENVQGKLRPNHWDTPNQSVLDNNPDTRSVVEWLSMESKGRKAS